MELKKLDYDFTVCKIKDFSEFDFSKGIYFLGKTDEEISLVCETENVPKNTLAREDCMKAFRIQGKLNFSLVGILSDIANILAAESISIFAVSTFNTDYVLVKAKDLERALFALSAKGYSLAN